MLTVHVATGCTGRLVYPVHVNVEEHVCVEKVEKVEKDEKVTSFRGTVRAADMKVYEFNIVTCTQCISTRIQSVYISAYS